MPALARTPLPDRPQAPSRTPRERIQLVAHRKTPAPDSSDTLRRPAPGIGAAGVHPRAVVAVLGLYAALLATFCVFFATPETGLVLFVIVVLAIMYFGLLGGGLLLADSRSPAEPRRSFAEFLNGPVSISTGRISGREALVQMIALPVALVGGAMIFGLIWRATSA
jgi:hypothetical protein